MITEYRNDLERALLGVSVDHEVDRLEILSIDGHFPTNGVKAGRVSQPDPCTAPLARFAFLPRLLSIPVELYCFCHGPNILPPPKPMTGCA